MSVKAKLRTSSQPTAVSEGTVKFMRLIRARFQLAMVA